MIIFITVMMSVFICLSLNVVGCYIHRKSKRFPKYIWIISFFISSTCGYFLLSEMQFGQNIIQIYNAFHDESNLPVNVMNGNIKVIKNRMQFDLIPNRLYQLDSGRISLLHIAGTFKQVEIAKLLVEAGESAKIIGYTNDNKIMLNTVMSATQGGSLDLVGYFIEKGADVNFKNYEQITPLHVAIAAGDIKVINLLIEKGAIVDAKNIYGTTSLMIAVQAGREDIANLLIDKGANPKELDLQGNGLAVYGANYTKLVKSIQKK